MVARTTMVGNAIIRVRPRPEVACSRPGQPGTIDVALQKRGIRRDARHGPPRRTNLLLKLTLQPFDRDQRRPLAG
jgi:hypothetical protein